MTVTDDMHDAILTVLPRAWTPAYDGDRQPKDGGWVGEITGMLDLSARRRRWRSTLPGMAAAD